MENILLFYFFVLGVLIGSFLNVVTYRFNTGKSIRGSSHCLSCGEPLRWFELVPFLSFLFQRGICRHCNSRIPVHYFFVELFTGVLFFLVADTFLPDAVLIVLNLILVSILMIILVYDIRHLIVPDKLIVYIGIIAIIYASFDPLTQSVTLPTFNNLFGALAPAIFLGSLWLVTRGRGIGLGDAKLVLPLGFILGLWESVSMLMFSFWAGAVVGVGALLLQKVHRQVRGQARLPFRRMNLTIKSEIPFAPFLILGFLLVHFFDWNAISFVYALQNILL